MGPGQQGWPGDQQGQPDGQQGWQGGQPTGQQGWPDGQQGWQGGQPGWPGGQQGAPGGQPGWPGGQQGWPGGQQGGQPGWSGGQQGWPGGQQGWSGGEATMVGPTAGYGPPTPPPGPPPPTGPAKSVPAAALLNLTGLSLGYAYLGRWVRAAVYLVATIAIVVIALLTGAGALPWVWRAVAFLWLGWMAVDAALLARRSPTPAPGAPRLVPVAVGVVAVLAVIGGYVGYGIAGHAAYTRGTDAMGRGDCAGAASAFDQVTGPFALTLGQDVVNAQDRRAECDQYLAAARGDTPAQITAYQAFRTEHPASPLRPFADESLGQAQLKQVDEQRTALSSQVGAPRASATRTAFETLLSVRRELAGTRAAGQVPDAMNGVFAAATAGAACDGLPSLDYLVTLPESETGSVVAQSKTKRAGGLLDCGLEKFRGGDYTASQTLMNTLTSDYPSDAGVPQAKAILLSVKVASKTRDPIPVPAPLNEPGSLRVTFYNITSSPMKVTLTGPSAGEVSLPGCGGCPATHVSGSGCPDPAGKPSGSVQVDPGLYHVLLDSGQANGGTVQTLTPIPNDELCVYRSAGT